MTLGYFKAGGLARRVSSRQMRVNTPCPACQERTIEYTAFQLDVPYFGEILQTVFICQSCGFRHTDVLVGRVREPRRFRYRCRAAEDMMVRVVRSTSGTVRIPELGVLIEPGPASEAFVSNVEGILVRVEAILDQLHRDAESPEQARECERRMEAIQAAREGRGELTLVLEDPYGNSAIVHEGAEIETIPPAEAEQLARGEVTFDVSEFEGGAKERKG